MKKTTICILLLLFAMLLALPVGAEGYDLGYTPYSDAVYMVNLDTGTVVFEWNARERIYPASTTKIMTTALALSMSGDPTATMVTVPTDIWDEFYGMNISTGGLVAGETLSMWDLCHAMLLQSANEAASTVAEYFGREAFFDAMNAKAVELGCVDTHFTNPHGLHGEQHYTTAEDLARITIWAMSVDGFSEIMSKVTYELPATSHASSRTLVTTIQMQNPYSSYYYPYLTGVKTGTTDEAGRCLVSVAQRNGVRYLLVVMGAPFESTDLEWTDGNSVFNETKHLYELAFARFGVEEVVTPDTPVTMIELGCAKGRDTLLLYAGEGLSALVDYTSENPPEITYAITAPERINAPIEVGQQIGSAVVYADGREIGSVPLLSRETVELSRLAQLWEWIESLMQSWVVRVLFGLLFLLVLAYLYYVLIVVARQEKRRKNGRKAPPRKRR